MVVVAEPLAVTVVGEAVIVDWVLETAPGLKVTVAVSDTADPPIVPLIVTSSVMVLEMVAV